MWTVLVQELPAGVMGISGNIKQSDPWVFDPLYGHESII